MSGRQKKQPADARPARRRALVIGLAIVAGAAGMIGYRSLTVASAPVETPRGIEGAAPPVAPPPAAQPEAAALPAAAPPGPPARAGSPFATRPLKGSVPGPVTAGNVGNPFAQRK